MPGKVSKISSKKVRRKIPIRKVGRNTFTKKTRIKNSQFFWLQSNIIKSFRRIMIPFIVLMLVVSINLTGLWAVGTTIAYYNDTETSGGNVFTADSLDFSLTHYSFESNIGLDETVSKNTVIVNSGGMDFQYTLEAEEMADEDGFCDALDLQAKLNGVEQYEGDLMSLATSASTTLGTWKFNIELPVDEDSFINGEECQFDVVFRGWQTNVASYGDGGFSDEERMSFTITAGKMVVLNEFLPRPDGEAYGFDFGNDSSDMPQGEWIELYNNSTESIDVAGWYTRDATDGEVNKVIITASNTSPATTIIPGKGWLVVYMNKPILNNTGDTVRLFNGDDVLVDSHTYAVSDFCEMEPTPDDDNSTDAEGGDCDNVPSNKSYARIPDGIGDWVDPIPTPGKVNVLEEEVSPLFSAFVDASGSGAGTEEIVIEETVIEETTDNTDEVIVEEEEMIVDEPVTEDEEVITEEDETVIEEEAIIGDDEVVVEEETVVEPEPEPQPSPEAMADEAEPELDNSGQVNNENNETI